MNFKFDLLDNISLKLIGCMRFSSHTLVVISLLLIAPLLYSGAVIKEFSGSPGFNRVDLKWVVTAEIGLKAYQVLRSLDDVKYENIAQIPVQTDGSGEKTYTYSDNSVFKQSGRNFYYKLRFLNVDGSTMDYEKKVTISPQISAARHTWGSIKAMFR